MRTEVRRAKKSLPIRLAAQQIIRDVVGHKNWIGQVEALHAWVRDNVQYIRDIRGVETLQTPEKTLEFRQGDCDDQSLLLAALLESVGHPTRFIAISLSPFGQYAHVYTETKIGERWVPVETTEKWQMGDGPKHVIKRMIANN